jgi:hypothetical protein
MLRDDLTIKARYLAYRWFRLMHLDLHHDEAWSFAQDNWKDFLAQAREPKRGPLLEVASNLPEPV